MGTITKNNIISSNNFVEFDTDPLIATPDATINATWAVYQDNIYHFNGVEWELFAPSSSSLPYYEVQMLLSEPNPIGDAGIFNIQEVLYDTFPGPTTWDIGGGINPGGDGGNLELGFDIHAVGSGIDFVNNATNLAKLNSGAIPTINGMGKDAWPYMYPNGTETIGCIFLSANNSFSVANFNNVVIPLTIRWYI